MSPDLSPADVAHRQRVTDVHLAAADRFGCTLDQERRWGWYDRSVSGSATRDGQKVWVRTVTEQSQWVATLYCHSLLVPDTAATIRHRFAYMLDTPDGQRSQLLAIARMLGRTRMGDYTDLVVPLHRRADEILGR
ncbi:hypothetical protein ACIA03_04270 [Nocardioides sp. NPDC051685]|uniref:hypothetical protein n=1 Tax=Nocardioides sp. NPDC051685 TaxID=3364334 RepID=UPI0037A436A9